MLRKQGSFANSSSLEVDMATADVHAATNPTSFESKVAKNNNTKGTRKLLYMIGLILFLTIFIMVVSIADEGFDLVSYQC